MGNLIEKESRGAQYPVREQITRRLSNTEYIFSEVLNRNDPRISLDNEQREKKLISISKSKAVQNQCHINGLTIKYIPSLKRIKFEYDCIQDSILNIYNSNSLEENLINTEKPIFTHNIPKSLNKEFQFDLKSDLKKNFVLEIKPKGLSSNSTGTIQLTFCEQVSKKGNNALESQIEIKRQCVLYNGKAFEIQNIFGLSNNSSKTSKNGEDSEKCVICLTNNRETILLPCRHACLCKVCSNALFKNTQDCPVCRNSVLGVVNIEDNKQNQY
ncbi:RING domain [Cryptosporidium sp. chipmunk genotype I]|uniref:RING domain n=1 Tax=Cryptosporidium sp. chipmunk genotype I TaxID=1280935 RepID=UPI00351A3C21|nr:RING domain [Cryptosporidium sp. chipmunk genotype I]